MRWILSACLCLAMVGCEPDVEPSSKKVTEKLAATEQQLDFDAFDSKNSFRSRATSVYYLISEDGMVCRVSLGEYAKAKVGQSYNGKWRDKE